MKIRAAAATGNAYPQFIVTPDTAEDRLLLQMFYRGSSDKQVELHFHGYGVASGKEGVESFNFGWSRVRANDDPACCCDPVSNMCACRNLSPTARCQCRKCLMIRVGQLEQSVAVLLDHDANSAQRVLDVLTDHMKRFGRW